MDSWAIVADRLQHFRREPSQLVQEFEEPWQGFLRLNGPMPLLRLVMGIDIPELDLMLRYRRYPERRARSVIRIAYLGLHDAQVEHGGPGE